MRRPFLPLLQLAIAVILFTFFSGCDKEKATRSYTWYTPVYESLANVRAEMKSGVAHDIKKTGKIYIYGKYIFLNEVNEGIHVIDNSQPTNPRNIAFLPIPGNVDMAVRGNYLYADSYADLVTIDISDPKALVVKKFNDDVFPDRAYYYGYYGRRPSNDSIKVVVGWERRDTTVSYENYRGPVYYDYMSTANLSSVGSNKATTGMGGSMARFTLMNNYLYTVTVRDLNTFDVAVADDPKFVKRMTIDGNQVIETIYPFKNKLFIGSTAGMFIYDVSTPGSPVKQGQFSHARSCDPVIADDNTAWVTLRSGSTCQGFTNQLEVVNINNLMSPSLIKTYPLTNPWGLSKEGDILFICDGKDGVKVYNASDPGNLRLIKHITGMESYDVIAFNNKAIVVAKDGLYQFDYTDVENIKLLSKIGLD